MQIYRKKIILSIITPKLCWILMVKNFAPILLFAKLSEIFEKICARNVGKIDPRPF
jgi:hypothetical protein